MLGFRLYHPAWSFFLRYQKHILLFKNVSVSSHYNSAAVSQGSKLPLISRTPVHFSKHYKVLSDPISFRVQESCGKNLEFRFRTWACFFPQSRSSSLFFIKVGWGAWRPENNLLKSVLFFYHMSSRDGTQVIRLDSKGLSLLSHFINASPVVHPSTSNKLTHGLQ